MLVAGHEDLLLRRTMGRIHRPPLRIEGGDVPRAKYKAMKASNPL